MLVGHCFRPSADELNAGLDFAMEYHGRMLSPVRLDVLYEKCNRLHRQKNLKGKPFADMIFRALRKHPVPWEDHQAYVEALAAMDLYRRTAPKLLPVMTDIGPEWPDEVVAREARENQLEEDELLFQP